MSNIQNMVKETEKKEDKKEDKVEESAEKKALRAYFDNYAKKNPVKYALKKEAFQKQLDSMK